MTDTQESSEMIEQLVLHYEQISVVVLDDDQKVAEAVSRVIRSIGCAVTVFNDPGIFLSEITNNKLTFDILVTDLNMPDIDGFQVMRVVRKQLPSAGIIVMTAYADKETAIQAFRLGILDILEKPFSMTVLSAIIRHSVHYQAKEKKRSMLSVGKSVLSTEEMRKWGLQAFIGMSEPFQRVVERIRHLQSAGNSRVPVLITGESGTGKELVARAIHFGGPRASGPFVPVNCSAVPLELAESLFFGHVKGSFTGALSDRKGAFSMASEGTLFLDEIADMHLPVQAKLLRVMEDGLVQPVGTTATSAVNVRVVAATNHDIRKRVSSGVFREDLFHRLSGVAIHLPPIRERKEDIPLLATHFARAYCIEVGSNNATVCADTIAMLKEYSFPGNIRELKNLIESALIENGCSDIKPGDVNLPGFQAKPHEELPRTGAMESHVALGDIPMNLEKAESVLIQRALKLAKGNYSEAARLLGISRTRLYRKLK